MDGADAAFDYILSLPALATAGAGDLTDYLAGKGYLPGRSGQLGCAVAADGTVRAMCDRDPTADLQAYAPAALPAPIDLLQMVLTAFTGTAAQKLAAVTAVQAVLAAPRRHRRQLVQGLD